MNMTDEDKKEMKGYLGMLNEAHGETLKSINDNFVLIEKRLDDHTRILNSHTEMIGEIKEDISIINET